MSNTMLMSEVKTGSILGTVILVEDQFKVAVTDYTYGFNKAQGNFQTLRTAELVLAQWIDMAKKSQHLSVKLDFDLR